MARIVSFVVLVVILLLIAGLFIKVMANFLLPMFLAVLLVVMFGPVHRWFCARCRGRNHLAAGLTTLCVLLIVLVPLLAVLAQAAFEGYTIYNNQLSQIDLETVSKAMVEFGDKVGLKHLDAGEIEKTIGTRLQNWLAPLALSTTKYLGSFLIGLAVMIISLYYFLADGPAMRKAIMRLSPLEDAYEEQLVEKFDDIARAVVLATLVSAVVQGVLVGIGFAFCGFGSLFLLMVLAMLFSMVPFIGAAAIWVPACLWLYFYEERTTAAILLAVYGIVIVSAADNIIKPLILHGRSNLHPLLALLSVLGGVQALGPIGIFVGPMVVVFLQTLLNMLNTELETIGDRQKTKEKVAAVGQ